MEAIFRYGLKRMIWRFDFPQLKAVNGAMAPTLWRQEPTPAFLE